MKPNTTLSSSYFPPTSWFALALRSEKIVIDIHEHYVKQTWRNRCRIGGANGPLDLIIPVKTSGNHTPMKDVQVDYATNWQRVHWHAIRSAYGKSPFFEFYADRIALLFEMKPVLLIDWNANCLETIISALKLKIQRSPSEEYFELPASETDYRTLISPRTTITDAFPKLPEYIQVFETRFGFQPDLSILDVLFCTGPESTKYLHERE